jgi:hypothetical protein
MKEHKLAAWFGVIMATFGLYRAIQNLRKHYQKPNTT